MKKNIYLNKNDRLMVQAIAKCGMITQEVATSQDHNWRVGYQRLDNLVKQGVLKEVQVHENHKEYTIYKLEDKGAKYVKENMDSINNIYKFQSYTHDNKLLEQFVKLSKEEQNNALTEGDIKALFSHKFTKDDRVSTPDIGVPVYSMDIENELVIESIQFMEVVTNHYTQNDIQMKTEYVSKLEQRTSIKVSIKDPIRA